jgi:NAD+ kinase
MSIHIRKVLLIANLVKPEAEQLASEIRKYLEGQDIEVVYFGFRGKPAQPVLDDFDLAVSLGGDGTVLFCSRILSYAGIPILGVNLGQFGFITEVMLDEWQEAFEKYRAGRLGVSPRLMLSVAVNREGTEIARFSGLNDSVIAAAGISKILKLTVKMRDTFLGRYRADGIIVATPTGSTAYSAAAGGPILHPELDAMILNPICPFTLSHRPIVVPSEEVIHIEVEEQQRTEVILTVDGQIVFPLEAGDHVQIRRAEGKGNIIRSDRRSFYEVLRTKLNWSGGPDA